MLNNVWNLNSTLQNDNTTEFTNSQEDYIKKRSILKKEGHHMPHYIKNDVDNSVNNSKCNEAKKQKVKEITSSNDNNEKNTNNYSLSPYELNMKYNYQGNSNQFFMASNQQLFSLPRNNAFGINTNQNNINNYHLYPIAYPSTFPTESTAFTISYGNQYYMPNSIYNYTGLFNQGNKNNYNGQSYSLRSEARD